MALDMYLKLDGIAGEATQKGFEKWIQIQGWSFGSTTQGGSDVGKMIAGKVSAQDFNFNMQVNSASPKLFLACCKGQHIPKATVVMARMPGNHKVMEYKFTDVLVTNFQLSGGAGDGGIPTESLSMSFLKMEFKYTPMKEDGTPEGSIMANYDLKQAKSA